MAGACLGLLAAGPAQGAGLADIGCFAGSKPGLKASCEPVAEKQFGEEVQLGGTGGMAVNYSGAGGVPKGTAYAASYDKSGTLTIAMFEPEEGPAPEEEGLRFVEGWQVTELEGPYEVCGPVGERLPNGSEPGEHSACSPREGGGARKVDVEIDQADGNVFVLNGEVAVAGRPMVAEYTATGGAVVTRFAELAPSGQGVAESPEKVHGHSGRGGLAVAGGGRVYIYDVDSHFLTRLMVFEPQGGNYAYAGEVLESFAGTPYAPVADAAGNLYVGMGERGGFIEEFKAAALVPGPYPTPAGPPACSFHYGPGLISSGTVNPSDGEVFFYSEKAISARKYVQRLGPCDEGTGKFAESGEGERARVEVSPERAELWAMAYDPQRRIGGRPEGVLYGAAPFGTPEGTGSGQPGQASLGYIFAAAEENPPAIDAQGASRVRATSARLTASIDPQGNTTAYFFEYEGAGQYDANPPSERFAGAARAPLAGGTLEVEGGSGARGVAVGLAGLEPETEYRYRVVASSHCATGEKEKICEAHGEDGAFRTFPGLAPGLLDGRAWELVSPAQKNGGQVLPAYPGVRSCGEPECKPGETYNHFPMQSSPDGDAIAYEGTNFGGGARLENEYIAGREAANGWHSANPTPALLESNVAGYKALGPGLDAALLEQEAGAPALDGGGLGVFADLFSQELADPLALRGMLADAAHPPLVRPEIGPGRFEIRYAGASRDLSRVFFAANDALSEEVIGEAPAAPPVSATEFDLYEWQPAAGQVRLVNVLPGNGAAEAGTFPAGSAGPVSVNGSRVFWTSKAGRLYVREGARTVPIPGGGPGEGNFLAAGSEGQRVLLSDGELYDLESETSTDLAEGQGGFQGLVGQSEDLSHAYFVDTAALTPPGEENERHEHAEAGEENLYAWSKGVPPREGASARFVAQLAAGDNSFLSAGAVGGSWKAVPANRTAEASPDGRYLTFLSRAPLTGYDNVGPCESNHAGGRVDAPCPEVFLYDSITGRLVCASCDPSLAPPLGWSMLRLNAGPTALPQARYLTDEGRLYFDSQDSLSPRDTNEGVEDVYEWEPNGVGGCSSGFAEGGCVGLLSSGREGFDSNLVTINSGTAGVRGGADVFFTTRERLLPRDTDELIDLYDAREGGGFAFEAETSPGPCQGEGCQALPPAAAETSPPSSSFDGPGNYQPPKSCKKGMVRRKGECVKAKAHKKRAKKSCGKGMVRRKGKCVKAKAHKTKASHAHAGRGGAK